MQSLTRCSMRSSAKRSQVAYRQPASCAGSRNLLHDSCCAELALCLKSFAAIAEHLPATAVAQCTLFDKSLARNWLVALHQDLSIPVRERLTHFDCTGWSEKGGRKLCAATALRPRVARSGSNTSRRAAAREPAHCVWCLARTGTGGSTAKRDIKRQKNGESECFAKRGDRAADADRYCYTHRPRQRHLPRRVLHFLFGPAELPHALTCCLTTASRAGQSRAPQLIRRVRHTSGNAPGSR